MVRWVIGSIHHGVGPIELFLVPASAVVAQWFKNLADGTSSNDLQPVLHDWCNKGHGMCYPVYGMVHIKQPLLLIGKSSLCGSSGFPYYQNGP